MTTTALLWSTSVLGAPTAVGYRGQGWLVGAGRSESRAVSARQEEVRAAAAKTSGSDLVSVEAGENPPAGTPARPFGSGAGPNDLALVVEAAVVGFVGPAGTRAAPAR